MARFAVCGRGPSPGRAAVGDAGGVSSATQPRPGHARTTRQQRIVDHVLTQGSASAAELVDLTGVSLMTVHRDVDELVRRGLVRKFRGGVSAQPTSVFESHSEYRLTVRIAEKNAIAATALEMVEPGSSIMVDDSTTALALVRRLDEVGPLTVVTNYLPARFDITRVDVEDGMSLYGHLRALGVNLKIAHQRISARLMTEEEAGLLDAEVPSACLTVERTAYDDVGQFVELGRHVYQAAHYSIQSSLVV